MTRVMGVLNVTPDSFSDGGLWLDPEAAIAHGRAMVAEGADIIDIGGESTRPGAKPVPEEEELRRVLPVIEALAAGTDNVVISIDTRKAAVAHAAVAAGASIINDVSASLFRVAAETGAGWIAMHMPADPEVMQQHAHYGDVVAEVRDFLVQRAEAARQAGVGQVWIDPGIGFGKTGAHNLSLLRHLAELIVTGFPVVIGTSRKSFLGRLAAGGPGEAAGPDDRLEGTVATSTWAAVHGADVVRVHDVRPVAQAVQLAGAAGAGAAGPADAARVAGAGATPR